MKKKLFEYAVLHHDQKDETVETDIIVKPTTLLAANEDTAALLVAREIPDNYIEDLENVEIIIRPF